MSEANKTTDLTALVLAGGRSTRFGTDKARHAVEGRAMIARVAEAAAAVAEVVLISVGADSAAYDVPGVLQVVDHYEGAGPLAGLHAGLAAARTSWVLAVACDMPFVTPAVLLAVARARGPGVEAVVARTPDGRRHPLCACYHQHTRPVVEAHLATGTLALYALLDRLKNVVYVDLPPGPLRNVNLVSDL